MIRTMRRTTMTEASPWDDIAVPGSDFNVRQVSDKTPVPCFWGRDNSGACLFILELEGDHTVQYRKETVTVRGIQVDLRIGETGRQRLVLGLERQVDRDLFGGLCRSLAVALEHANDSATALGVALTHIRRWKAFLSGSSQRLSAEEVRGLFAELAFLMELLDKQIAPRAVVAAWLGPERAQQDFDLGNRAVEIKSLSGSERNSVRISSEDQLDSLKDQLFLRIYRLSNLVEASTARSLNQIAREVEGRMDSDCIADFDRKLVAYGYAPLPEYEEPLFAISEVRTYSVVGSFPRLIRSSLASGLRTVSYEIDLEDISDYRCDDLTVFKEL
jgi:hypothetical protein